jgi:hypothetical protein
MQQIEVMHNQEIEIPLKKIKIGFYLLGAMVFVLLGGWMINSALLAKNQLVGKFIFFIIGLSGVLFFGLLAFVLLIKIFNTKAGLILSDEGITDNTSAVAAGFISWKEIRKINVSNSGSNSYLVVLVKNPEKFIKRERNFIKRFAMRMNYKMTGTPIHILANFLDIDLYTLDCLITDKRLPKNTLPNLDPDNK